MKKILKWIVLLGFIALAVLNIDKITDYFAELLSDKPKLVIPEKNEYYKNISYSFVQESEDFIPYSKQDLKNIFYSILNNGYTNFTFYCPKEYTDCLTDTESIIKDDTLLTNINNFVHPFNNFSNINVVYSSVGEVNVKVTKLYSNDDIEAVIHKVNEIYSQIITDDMSLDDKILTIHDYIINNTKYDQERANNNSTYKSNIAYGPLLQGYAVCGGYADAMALFLNKLNVPNYKVASLTHVWNAVKVNDEWLHIDLTWDDPVALNSDKDTLLHKFYLINTKKLESYKIDNHEYDKFTYVELS